MSKDFYSGEMEECVHYRNFDIPMTAAKFIEVWSDVKISSTKPWCCSFLPQDLELIENIFRLLLIFSSNSGKFILDGETLLPSLSKRVNRIHTVFSNVSPVVC